MQLIKKNIETNEQLVKKLEQDKLILQRKFTKAEFKKLKQTEAIHLIRKIALNENNDKLKKDALSFLLTENPFSLLHYEYLKKHLKAKGLERSEKLIIYRRIEQLKEDRVRKLNKQEIKTLTESLCSWPELKTNLFVHELIVVGRFLEKNYNLFFKDQEYKNDLICLLYILQDNQQAPNRQLNAFARRLLDKLLDLEVG